MMEAQSLDFNIGYAFNIIERSLFRCVRENRGLQKCTEMTDLKIQIPKIWFGLKCRALESDDLSEAVKQTIISKLTELFKSLTVAYDITITIQPFLQYIDIRYTIKKTTEPRKITISEIQALLGSEFEIVFK